MTPLEATALCRFTKAVCPQQAIDEYTPDAWHPLLEDIRFEDAKAAVINAGKKKPFISPAEIRAEVKMIREDRIRAYGALPAPPADLADNAVEYMAHRAELLRAIADGEAQAPERVPADPEVQAQVLRAIEGTFPDMPRPERGRTPVTRKEDA